MALCRGKEMSKSTGVLKKMTTITSFLMLITMFLSSAYAEKAKKLYWFIPDGMRAEPGIFNIYQWAEDGELPNIKKIMENGTYGFCKPVYPGHTPVNFASLFTGAYPEVHGVSDGPMHTSGHPLTKPAVAGFRSDAKKVTPIWKTLEEAGKKVALLSIPGSTPPELKVGYTVLGRWGGWGANFHSVNFEELGDGAMLHSLGRGASLFFLGQPLTVFQPATEALDSVETRSSVFGVKTVLLEAWGNKVQAIIADTTDDSLKNYDTIIFQDKDGEDLVRLRQGEWSHWLSIKLQWNDVAINTEFKICVIKLSNDGFYRIRFVYNSLNATVTQPSHLAADIIKETGPLVDFVDNFPPQLIFYDEDKEVFLEEARMSFEGHRKMARHVIDSCSSDVIIHDIYTPNQMLTSRWWLGYIDPQSARYDHKDASERAILWKEVKEMYKQLDAIIGEYLAKIDENTYFVLSSDHGAAPLNKWVHLNNFFAKKGWLSFTIDPNTGVPIIDWEKSKVVYLKFGHIYVHPDGLHDSEGKWNRAQGEEYEVLRAEVITALSELADSDGTKPVQKIARGEEAENMFRLPFERVGDIVIANRPGYGWNEEMSNDHAFFTVPLKTGYKQSIMPDASPSMWTPFMIMGPGIKKNVYLGGEPVSMIDQYPTIMNLLEVEIPTFVQGKVLKNIMEVQEE